MPEVNVMRDIQVALCKGPTRVFRNNVGMAWQGDMERGSPHAGRSDRVILYNARPVHFGLCVGSADLIGWNTVTITPEMVGQRIAVFTAIEVKRPRGAKRREQENFGRAVQWAGGIFAFARSVDEAAAAVIAGVRAPGLITADTPVGQAVQSPSGGAKQRRNIHGSAAMTDPGVAGIVTSTAGAARSP